MKITKTQLRKMINEARMAEYGKQDAAAGRPPSKVGRKDTEYMAAYEDEKENQISSREKKFGDALPPSSDELLDGLVSVTQALADVIGDGGGPYDHLIVDVEEAVDLIQRAGREW